LTENNWAIVRQVVIAAEDLDATSKLLREALGLAPGFPDPMLEDIGLSDETIRVGPEAHLEVVAPLNEHASVNRWLAKGGGGGGYALSIQVPDVAARVAAAESIGVAVVADLEAYGRRIVQLHPRDMGLLLEVDEIPDPLVWFWDDIETEQPESPLVDDVLSVDLQSPDPQAQALKWATVFGVPVELDAGVPRITLGTRTLRFVQGERTMLSAVSLAKVDGESDVEELTVSNVVLHLR
jgi:hypothetical protein